jgi:hypothetical protein
MIRKQVSSSNIRSIGFELESLTLEIEFNTGSIYQYYDVPASVHDSLMEARSHGSYFSRHIKDRYRWRKMK